MTHTKLSEHIFKKGKFQTQMSSIMSELSDDKSWSYGRIPEYIWIGLIINHYGRVEGLKKMYLIITLLHKINPDLTLPRLSDIIKMEESQQHEFFKSMNSIISSLVLSPLSLILSYSKAKIFSQYYTTADSIKDRMENLIGTMESIMDHQSHEATDIRFVVLYFNFIAGKMFIQTEQGENLIKYPSCSHSDEIMRMLRPTVRSMELMTMEMEKTDKNFIDSYWKRISSLTDCSLFGVSFQKEERTAEKYSELLHEIFVYLRDLYSAGDPLNAKMSVLLGIATYSYKRFMEVVNYNLFNSISGRSTIRILIENYIMMKYLLNIEHSHINVWRDFQFYGIGQYKLVLARHRETDILKESHFDIDFINALVNEFKSEEFINMDTRYFDNLNIRLKAEAVGEKELYGLLYDYDSSYEHGLWGAIRESSMLKCNNPAHQYHLVPDVENEIQLKSVFIDMVMLMNKTINLLNEEYGLPSDLLREILTIHE